MIAHWTSKEYYEKISQANIARWANPKNCEAHGEAMREYGSNRTEPWTPKAKTHT